MKTHARHVFLFLSIFILAAQPAWASAYNARPKLIVVIIVDQLRGDLPERYRDQFGEGGFRLFMDHGAYFTDCNYNYANTRTAPGHATLGTGAYTNGHGIGNNEWWDPVAKKSVTSIEDASFYTLTVAGAAGKGASPHNELASTLGDELKLSTGGKARVFGIALKDRAAILPVGHAADAAYWIDRKSGAWVSSTYYMKDLPQWVKDFDNSKRADAYWNREWKDQDGKTLRTTAPPRKADGTPDTSKGFYDVVGESPFGNDYEFEFARQVIQQEKLGVGPNTDLLYISLSAYDIVGHVAGPDSPEMHAMTVTLDHQLEDFFKFLGQQIGMANVWMALSADHGVAPMPAVAAALRLPGRNMDSDALRKETNGELNRMFSPGKNTEYVAELDWPIAYLSEEAFRAVKANEGYAEQTTGEVLQKNAQARGFYTREHLMAGWVAPDIMGDKYANSVSPYGGWYVQMVPAPYSIGYPKITDHSTPYTYDTHVPLAFYGLPFEPGTYRTHAEPVDMAATLASLLGINAPTHAVGRVLTEALRAPAGGRQP